MKKVFLVLFSILLLFSCATGKELERVETTVEKVEESSVIEGVVTEPVPVAPIVDEEKEELDLSSFPLMFTDGEFIDIKDESALAQKEERKKFLFHLHELLMYTILCLGFSAFDAANIRHYVIEALTILVFFIVFCVFFQHFVCHIILKSVHLP